LSLHFLDKLVGLSLELLSESFLFGQNFLGKLEFFLCFFLIRDELFMGSFLFLDVGGQLSLLIKQLLSEFSGFLHFLSKFVSQLLSFFDICLS